MTQSIAVATDESAYVDETRALSTRLDLPYFVLKTPLKFATDYDYLLLKNSQGLAIAKTGKGAPKPVMVDFTSGAVDHRRRFGGGKGQDIAKAVGLNKRSNLTVLDATAGLGRDGFVLATLGCQVSLCERVGLVRHLLADGLYRASMHAEVSEIVSRMSLIANHINEIAQSTQFDVVFLDPMYPHTDKSSAAAKKEMAFFRDLVGKDEDAGELLVEAKQRAMYRVVVKRPKGAPFLNQEEPTYQLEGKSGRFDVYVIKSLDQDKV